MVTTLAREDQQSSHPVATMAGEGSGPRLYSQAPVLPPGGLPGVQGRVARVVSNPTDLLSPTVEHSAATSGPKEDRAGQEGADCQQRSLSGLKV